MGLVKPNGHIHMFIFRIMWAAVKPFSDTLQMIHADNEGGGMVGRTVNGPSLCSVVPIMTDTLCDGVVKNYKLFTI